MGLKTQLSFSSGELDPILNDFVTLEKFKKGLATGRNVVIGKTGTIMSRFARAHFVKAKNDGEPIRIYSPPNSGILTEWGIGYVRVYDFNANLLADVVTTFVEADLLNLHFESSRNFLYVFSELTPLKFDLESYTFVSQVGSSPTFTSAFKTSLTPDYLQSFTPAGTPSGYRVDYAISYVVNGEEYSHLDLTGLGTFLKPDGAGQSNTVLVRLTGTGTETAIPLGATELRVYRRPNGGGAFGFIGSSTTFYLSTGDLFCDFIDRGGNADFTNNPTQIVTNNGLKGKYAYQLNPKTGLVYQQRLLVANFNDYADPIANRTRDEEGIIASRPGFQNNFQRDFPYDADSALLFKSGTSGKANVLRMIDNDGLIVFTSVGIFINTGLLSIDNVALAKQVGNVIDDKIPPLVLPGGVFFVDKSTNSIRQFVYSNDIGAYEATNQSIFSDHLFKERTITSWAFQRGVVSVVIVTFSDGTFATFTYDHEHQMKAWTRHDSKYPVEEVAEVSVNDSTFFVTNKDGNRYIEVSLPRRIPADEIVSNPEADKLASNTMMDALKTKKNLLNESLVTDEEFELVPTIVDDWEDNLTLTCGTSALFPNPGLGEVGTVFRFFDVTDKSTVNLEVVSRTSDNEVVVKPSAEFPLAQSVGFRLYETFNEVTGLDHLEGENVSVVVDGFVVNSPNNDIENYDPIIVTSGTITLPDSIERGAIIVVGRPFTADVKTLNISTLEQKPTMIESLTVDKLYIRVHETRGLYVDNEFPEVREGLKDGSTVKGMEDLFKAYIPDGFDFTGNRYIQPISKRIEQTLPGDWDTNGEMALRQVDPVHFEILSIIPDVEVFYRSNK